MIALLVTALALVASIAMQAMTGGRVVIMPFFPAVIAVALYSGVWPAIGCSLVTLCVGFFSWREAGVGSLRASDLWALSTFALSAALIIIIAARLRNAEQRRASLLVLERKAREEAEQVGRMKDEFLATLSHELRNPLSAIVGWAQVLLTQPLSTQVVRGLEIIERNARAQTRIIDDLLDMSRIVAGTTRLAVREVDLQKIVDAALLPMQPAAQAKGIALERMPGPPLEPAACDPDRLNQVIWNLLTNAVKFTPEGGRVEVRIEQVHRHAEICVRDTGMGIEPDFLPFVFDRFRQADSTITRQHSGLGLGLSICKHLIELHGGTLRASSEGVGKGAAFTIRLPSSPTHGSESVAGGAHEPAP